MPAGKRQQSNTMLYTVIVFVALFLISTVFAVVFYVKSEEYKNREAQLQKRMDEIATNLEQAKLASTIGSKERGESYIKALLNYHDHTLGLLMGKPIVDNPADLKTEQAQEQVKKIVAQSQPFIAFETVDPNTGLVVIAEKLIAALNTSLTTNKNLNEQIDEMKKTLDSTVASSQANIAKLEEEKQKYQDTAGEILTRYEQLKVALEKAGEERASNILARLEKERETANRLNQDLLKTQAQLDLTQERMKGALTDLRKIEPVPDLSTMTYVPDGKITLVDEVGGRVYIDLGREDHVYKGLTFSVYTKATAIPKDGKSKAEIEVFKIMDNSAVARIVSRDPHNPIALDDIIANLIWDRDQSHEFVIAGEFDLNNDGFMEADAVERISSLITKWGGSVSDKVTPDTHVILLGNLPVVPKKPSFEDLENDPLAQDRFEAAQKRLDTYQEIYQEGKDLMLPMYKYEKFLYLIGYKGSVAKPGAFL